MPVLPLVLVVITHNEAANIARRFDRVPFVVEKLMDCAPSAPVAGLDCTADVGFAQAQ